MTPYAFRAEVRRLFGRVPLTPVVVDLVDGRRVVIDMPRQVQAVVEGITVLPAAGPAVSVPADAVRRVVGYDELPAEPGALSYRQFYAAVRPLARAEPFNPFVLELQDGRRLEVDRPTLLLAGRFGLWQTAGGPQERFTTDQVARVLAGRLAEAA